MFGCGDIFLVTKWRLSAGSLEVKDHLTAVLKTSLNIRNLVSTRKFWILDNSSDEMHIIFGDDVNNLYNCIGINLPRVS